MKIKARKIKFTPDEDKQQQIISAVENHIKGVWLYKFLTKLLLAVGVALTICGLALCMSVNNSLSDTTQRLSWLSIGLINGTILAAFIALSVACYYTARAKVEKVVSTKNVSLSVHEKTLKYIKKNRRHTITVEVPLFPDMKASYNAKLRKITFFGNFKEKHEFSNEAKNHQGSKKGLVVYDCYHPSAHLILSQMGVPFVDEKEGE